MNETERFPGTEVEVKKSEIEKELAETPRNPNNIGEVLSIGKDLATSPDKVYRSVFGREAIEDLQQSGIVRNKQSAGLVEQSRWGEKVFWSKGAEGKYHAVQQGGFVMEAPLSVAEERVVRKEDITAIYEKNENGIVSNILSVEHLQTPIGLDGGTNSNEEELHEIRKNIAGEFGKPDGN